MRSYGDIRAQQENVDEGGLKVTVMTADGTRPVENALVRISLPGVNEYEKNRFSEL